ncbi:carbohydrate sulfotransferase 15-like [Argopecten irradians]|uniref:carbohydrate sulfotransferase 15-like n=1 Tax=Argopecten irradians TaxID=31199 RepID=UPI00371EC3BA
MISYVTGHEPYTFTEYIDYFDLAAQMLHASNDSQRKIFITGEGSPSTLWDLSWWWQYSENKNDEDPALTNAHFVRHILPDVKLVVILRNPVDRLYSDYIFMNPKEKKSKEIFHSKASRSVRLFNDCLRKHTRRHCAYQVYFGDLRLTIGLYAVFLEDWMAVFPRKQFFITTLDDYSKNQTGITSEIFDFLGLRAVDNGKEGETHYNRRRSSGIQAGAMLDETRQLLEQFYQPFDHALSSLLNDEKYLWRI